MDEAKTYRDKGNGRYAHGNMEALCVCGHSLGDHAAACYNGERPCFIGDETGETCECLRFRKPRKSAAKGK